MALALLILALLASAPGLARGQDDGREKAKEPENGRAPAADPEVGRSYRVPYRLTNTNHYLVRVRINGKGPFNFLVDTGAPALYVATETARRVGLRPEPGDFWTPLGRLDFEGGAHLDGLKARVEDQYQLVGMNALGLPGASIDGILGFTVLARFRMEIDPTRDRMTWTRLDFVPPEPPVPRRPAGERPPAGDGTRALNLLGPLAKFLAIATGGKRPEDQLFGRGVLGLELADDPDGGPGVRVAGVLADSPASRAGVRPGDRLVRVLGREVAGVAAARDAVAEVRPDDRVPLIVRRVAAGELTLTATAGPGF
jgi:hypothetical protein